jgi:hypothetical protein
LATVAKVATVIENTAVEVMTAKAWCAISKALKLIAAAQNTSLYQAQVWLIEACAAGNVRSREPWREPDWVAIPAALITVSRKRAPLPVVPTAWKGALIDKDGLVDVGQVRWSDIEISLADLEFELKKLPPLDGASSASAPFRKKGGRASDKDTVATEASRRLTVGENIPSSLAAFARDLHSWLDKQPLAKRSIRGGKVLSAPSIEEHIRPLWRKYRPD